MSADLETSPSAREREVFLNALEKPPAERAAFLDAQCGGNRDLRRRVEELLIEQGEVGAFLETPVLAGTPSRPRPGLGPNDTAVVAAVTEKPGDRIGRYKLLQVIGEGGCGVVYMAEQEEPVRRRVALKVIKLGMDTRSVIARFEAERQALAMMDHPNIAKVLDGGATETGRPYFVMELVRGIRVTDYCDQNQLSMEARLRLMIQICHAIQHAHQKGIIHRDIKPSNILVTLHDGVPVPKVIDFGIAKATEQRLTDKTLFTEFTTFIGTPAYMSPEQAEMSGLDIDTRSDIYSLGVLLYELLVGWTPFDAETLLRAGLDECRRTIREEEPIRPSTRLATMLAADLTTTAQQRRTDAPRLIHLLRGDVDWIAMKCLEKDRARRFATASDLAADLQRYLDGEPVVARPPSNAYRLRKLVQRHRRAFAAALAMATVLVAGATVSAWLAVRATKAEHQAHSAQIQETRLRQQAERDRGAARLNEYVADINLAQQSLAAGNFGRAVQLLAKHRPAPGEPDLRGFEWRHLWQLSRGDPHVAFPNQDGSVLSLAVSPAGDRVVVGLRDRFSIWDLRLRTLITNLPKGAVSLAYFPDGRRLVSASPLTVRVWNTADWTEEKALPENTGPLALSPDGSRLLTMGGRQFPVMNREAAHVWDTATWTEARSLPGAGGDAAFAADGKTLATDSKAGITLWPMAGGRPGMVLPNSTNLFSSRGGRAPRGDRALAFSSDGRFLVAARNTLSERGVFLLSIWDTRTGEESVMPDDPEHIEHTGAISSVAFSPDGRTLATASMDYSIRLWDFSTRQRIATLQGHLNEVWSLAFSPDSQTLVSGTKDGEVKLWSTRRQTREDVLTNVRQPLAISRDGLTLAGLTRERSVLFVNLATGEAVQQFPLEQPERARSRFPRPPPNVAVSDDLRIIASGLDGGVRLWNTEAGETNLLDGSERAMDFVALSPDGRRLITRGSGRGLRSWDLRHQTNAAWRTEAFKVLFSPDSGTLATFGRSNTVQLWDAAALTLRMNLVAEEQPGFAAAFSANGGMLAVGCQDDVIRFWDTANGTLLGAFTGHKQAVQAIAFSPDGKTLVTASEDSTLKFWNVATQQELLTVRRLGGALRALMFSPDGQLLAAGTSTSTPTGGLRLYRAPLLKEVDAVLDSLAARR